MNIRFEENDEGQKIAYLEGEINTLTAKDFEAALDENVDIVDDLVLDFAGVSYISSAGLRVLMKMQKQMNRVGSMTLRNTDDEVYDILKLLKLDKILNVEGRVYSGDDSEETDVDVEFYSLTDEDKALLPDRIKELLPTGKLTSFSISQEGEMKGFAIYDQPQNEGPAYLLYVYINENCRGQGLAKTLITELKKILADQDISDFYIVCMAGMDGEKLAEKLGFEKTNKTRFLLVYNKKQIMESVLWKKIDGLRPMFDKIKLLDELDFMEKSQLGQMMGDEDIEMVDPLYARIFMSEGNVVGLLNARETENLDIFISKIMVLASKDASRAIVIMLSSLLDAVFLLLKDDNTVTISAQEKQIPAFKQLLGEPMENSTDVFYKSR